MKWNDPTIDQAIKNGLVEFSKLNRNSLKFDTLKNQLEFVINKQEMELKHGNN